MATASASVRTVLDRLDHVQPHGDYWMARCPAHEDRVASLSISVGEAGRTILKCHAGCETAAIVRALGIAWSDLFPPARQNVLQIAARYDYRDETGLLLYQAVRFEPKAFRQRSPKPGGGWQWKLDGARRVLYRLPDVLAARPERFVFVVEGEKDADALWQRGFVATTNVGGAGKWKPEYSASLRGRIVIILPDNDKPGREHADQVAASLVRIARSIRVLALDGLPDKGDVSDWLEAGHTADDLLEAASHAAEWQRPAIASELPPSKPALKLVCMADVQAKKINWLWQDRLASGKLHLACGVPGVGKSFVCTIDIPAILSTGRDWPDGKPGPQPGEVLILVAEDGIADTVRPRLDAAGADVGKIFVLESRLLHGEDGNTFESHIQLGRDIDAIDNLLAERPGISLVVIDPLTEYIGPIDSNSNTEVRAELTPLMKVAERRGVAIIGVSHFNKSQNGPALFRALGSIAFTALARLAWAFIRDQSDEERVLMLPLKSNICRTAPGLAFRVIDDRIAWEEGEVHTTADQALNASQTDNQSQRLPEAVAWLRERLTEGCQESSELIRDAIANGITRRTLFRARKTLKVKATKSTSDGSWYVSLPDAGGPEPQCERGPETVGTLGTLEVDDELLDEIGNLFP